MMDPAQYYLAREQNQQEMLQRLLSMALNAKQFNWERGIKERQLKQDEEEGRSRVDYYGALAEQARNRESAPSELQQKIAALRSAGYPDAEAVRIAISGNWKPEETPEARIARIGKEEEVKAAAGAKYRKPEGKTPGERYDEYGKSVRDIRTAFAKRRFDLRQAFMDNSLKAQGDPAIIHRLTAQNKTLSDQLAQEEQRAVDELTGQYADLPQLKSRVAPKAPAASAAAKPALPQGAKVVGKTPDGKDIVLFPDGKKRVWSEE